MSNTPSLDGFRAAFSYDPETGVFCRLATNTSVRSTSASYATVSLDGGSVYAHRLAWAMVHGGWPEEPLDHINGDRTDNRIANLRAVPQKLNCRNCRISKNNRSGANGVYWSNGRRKWVAQIMVDYRTRYLGIFETIEAAIKARKAAEREAGFHPNHGRLAA